MRGFVPFVFLLLFSGAPAQEYGRFDVLLDLNVASAEQAVGLYEGLTGNPRLIAQLPGSRIALATTSTLERRPLSEDDLVRALEAVKFNQDTGDDPFRMTEARSSVREIKEILAEVRRRNFAQRVVSTVAQLFPAEARVSTRIPVYVVAFGSQAVDAYVRRVRWTGETPVFVGEGEGELTIVVNLSRAVAYGRSTDERFIGLLTVVAHEVFHAAFGVYKDGSQEWRRYYDERRTPFDRLLDLSQNEGIAYYLTLVQKSRGALTPEWERGVRAGVQLFNERAEELLDPRISRARAQEILQQSNTSGLWNSFGAVTGMIAARAIDQTLGRASLSETIARGPDAFFGLYADLMKQDSSLPQLSPRVLREISLRR